MSTIEALKATWPSTYLVLFAHLAIAAFVFYRKVANQLVDAGMYSDAAKAARHSIFAYLLSSCLILVISHPVQNTIFGVNETFDVRLVPMYYQWLGRIILTPVSIIGNLYVLQFLIKDIESSKRKGVLRIVASAELRLFLVNLLFAALYV